jgi:hypothetical protein
MAIYRPDQAQLSFASEGAQGADSELKVASVVSAGARALAVGALTPGMSEITYDNMVGSTYTFTVGDFVRIGVIASTTHTDIADTAVNPYEVRRIESHTVTVAFDTGVIRLDRPIAFNHKDNIQLAEATAVANTAAQEALSIPSMRFMPGAYTSVTVPDLTPTLEPRYFLGNNNRRNFTEVYRGTQAYSGSLGGVTALNGFMLRFGIGDVRTALLTDNDYGKADYLINNSGTGSSKGDMHIYVDGTGATVSNHDTALVAGAYIQIIDYNTVIGAPQSAVHDGGDGTAYLEDGDATFVSAGVQVGDIVYNTTGKCSFRVGTVTSETVLTPDANGFQGTGSQLDFDDDDKYLVVTQGQNTLAAAAVSGTVSAGANTGTITGTYKVARTIGTGPQTDIFLETPLKETYTDNSFIIPFTDETTSVYQHVITEANLLPTMTWHLRMLDSDGGNAFIRRSLGGMVDSMTINADEGGMLTVGWDTVNFMGTIHNLENQLTATTDSNPLYSGDSASAVMPGFAVMHDVTDSDIDFDTTEPYYFSEGAVYIGGAGATRKEFARVRDFSIGISNAVEQRYYVSSRHGNGRRRGPNEMREGRREYTFTATVSLNDSSDTTGTDIGGALELYKQLLLEGNYGSGAQGFNVRLTFTRGTNDTMVIDLPGDATAATGLAQGGVFLRGAPHDIAEEPTLQTSIDCVARNMKIVITDGVPVYP